VDPAASYRITVNSFLADGGDLFSVLREGTDRLSGAVDTDALEAYLAPSLASAPIAPPALDRIDVVP
jgi:5'-nucleotidase